MADDGFEGFYRATYGRLVGQLLAVGGDRGEAEDCVQEAFVRASTRWQRLRDYEVPEAWVRRVAFNLLVSSKRRRRSLLAALARLGPPPDLPPLSADSLTLVEAMRGLPIRQRQVLVLHHGIGLPVLEVARELGVPVGSVKGWLARGRTALTRQLEINHQAEKQPEEGHHVR